MVFPATTAEDVVEGFLEFPHRVSLFYDGVHFGTAAIFFQTQEPVKKQQ